MAKLQSQTRLKIALVGSETLLGKELDDVVGSRSAAQMINFAASGEGNFGEAEGEAVYVEPLETRTVQDARAVLIAGTREGALKAYQLAKAAGGRLIVIDCTGHLENQPEVRIVAPLVSDVQPGKNWLFEIAHPAASALALCMKRLSRQHKIKQVLAHVFEPASEQGTPGILELQKQTTNLLAFKPLDQKIFDAQLSFNLLAQYGEESARQLSAVEGRIERDVATILSGERAGAGTIPMPSIRVVGAPVFHGYSLSVWIEFESDVTAEALGEALASAQIEIRGPKEEVPTGVGAAGQSGVMAGDIRIDRNNPRAAWFWMVGDNLRLTADAAADLVNKLESAPQ